jgi:type II secretory pathway pseudopilin PulG
MGSPVTPNSFTPRWRSAADAQAGMSLIELVISMGVLTAIMGLAFQSLGSLNQATTRDSTQSYVMSRARGAVELVSRSLRDDFVMFNTVPGTPLGINFDLNDASGKPVVRDGILYYIDLKHKAQIYPTGSGQAFTAGLTDADGDGKADVIGIGLVPQDLNADGVQDFIDLNHDGVADDLDGDGIPDPLWTLTMVHFNNINNVSNVNLWRQGQTVATNVIIRKIVPAGLLSGSNVRTFQFSAHNPTAMLYDTVAYGGNANDIVDENELGNMTTVDGTINDRNEVASVDSITITLNVVEVAREGLALNLVLSGDISSDLITPRTLSLIRRNGIVGLPDPTQAFNIQ